jgi:enoyl-CoA hydratase/carnithine racemase
LDYVSIEKRDGVAIVRFDRKANLNAFNEKLVVELTHAAQGFFDDLETHVVVLTGAPNAFSAGFDLKAVDSWPSETDDLKRRYRAYGGVRLCRAWESMPQITIAAIEKLAVGAGVAIALACDWRVLARDAYVHTRGQDRSEPAVGCLTTAHHPGRSSPRQTHYYHVRENACRSSARLGVGR